MHQRNTGSPYLSGSTHTDDACITRCPCQDEIHILLHAVDVDTDDRELPELTRERSDDMRDAHG